MRRPGKAELRFVRALLGGAVAQRDGESFVAGEARLEAGAVRALAAEGVVSCDVSGCRAAPGTRQWLKRQMIEADAFAAQHRVERHEADGTIRNLAESPLSRLAAPSGDAGPFLAPHHVEAGERVRKLVERARLQPRLTMSYAATNTAGKRGRGSPGAEIGDMAADARKALAEIHRQLPRDCAEVVLDVCGLEKGLQLVETERGWPRRSAKLVLRIGLDRLAEQMGLAETAQGPESRRRRTWMDGERPAMFGDEVG